MRWFGVPLSNPMLGSTRVSSLGAVNSLRVRHAGGFHCLSLFFLLTAHVWGVLHFWMRPGPDPRAAVASKTQTDRLDKQNDALRAPVTQTSKSGDKSKPVTPAPVDKSKPGTPANPSSSRPMPTSNPASRPGTTPKSIMKLEKLADSPYTQPLPTTKTSPMAALAAAATSASARTPREYGLLFCPLLSTVPFVCTYFATPGVHLAS